jgi:hypothetical protein
MAPQDDRIHSLLEDIDQLAGRLEKMLASLSRQLAPSRAHIADAKAQLRHDWRLNATFLRRRDR